MTREIKFALFEQGRGDIDSRELCGEEKDFHGDIYTESFHLLLSQLHENKNERERAAAVSRTRAWPTICRPGLVHRTEKVSAVAHTVFVTDRAFTLFALQGAPPIDTSAHHHFASQVKKDKEVDVRNISVLTSSIPKKD
jgi:hypothetical protein